MEHPEDDVGTSPGSAAAFYKLLIAEKTAFKEHEIRLYEHYKESTQQLNEHLKESTTTLRFFLCTAIVVAIANVVIIRWIS